MSKLTKEEKEEQKFKAYQEKMEFDALVRQNKGKPFSTKGICTLKRYWINYIIWQILYSFVTKFLSTVMKQLPDMQIERELYILLFIVISFWLLFSRGVFSIYVTCLKIQRFRSVDLNPWLALIPLYSNFVTCFIPCKKDFQNNKYFNSEIKHKVLFIIILTILTFLCIVMLFYSQFKETIIPEFL